VLLACWHGQDGSRPQGEALRGRGDLAVSIDDLRLQWLWVFVDSSPFRLKQDVAETLQTKESRASLLYKGGCVRAGGRGVGAHPE